MFLKWSYCPDGMMEISLNQVLDCCRPFLSRYSMLEHSRDAWTITEVLAHDALVERLPHWYELLAFYRDLKEEGGSTVDMRYPGVSRPSHRNRCFDNILSQDALGIVDGQVVFGQFKPKAPKRKNQNYLEIDEICRSVPVPERLVGCTGYITSALREYARDQYVLMPLVDAGSYEKVARREDHWEGFRQSYYPRFRGLARFHIGDRIPKKDVFFQLAGRLNPLFELTGGVPEITGVYGDRKTTIWLTK